MTITRISEIIRGYLGWCPNARTMRTAPPAVTTPPVTIHPTPPDGGAGSSGRIDRGIKLAIGSIRILFRNLRLLWFTLLTGLVMIISFASSLYLQFITGTTPFPGTNLVASPASVLIARGSLTWFALTFTTGLIISFLTYYLLAALIVCVSLILSGRTATIREGLAHARQYIRPLLVWAIIWAFVGTVETFIISPSMSANGSPGNLGLIFITMVVMAVIFVLTLFVVPLIVLGNESLFHSVTESVALFRKIWGEIIACLLIFFLIAFAVLLISLIPMIVIGFSTGSAGAFVVADLLVMFILLVIGSTVVEIAIVGLYTFGKTGTMSAIIK
jgi:Family of unknown function (DUF6159)